MRSALLIALAALLVACGAPATSPTASPTTGISPAYPTRICDASEDAELPPISCTEAIGKALLALGPDARSVQSAWYRAGAPCPPNARCIAPPADSAYVVVRFEGGRSGVVRLTTEGGEVIAAAPEQPTYDIWPSTGEAAPAPVAPDIGPDAPGEIAFRNPLPLCVDERRPQVDHPARACFLEAVLDGRPAEMVIRTVDQAGDPVVELYRYTGGGPVLVYRSPSPAGPGWVRNDCAMGQLNDDQFIFVVQECLSTELS